MEIQIGRKRLRLRQGDITRVAADAIVNAANSALAGGGGVDGAIHRAGGPAIMQELMPFRQTGGCPTGSAVATGAGNLPAKYVFHAVGPVYRRGETRQAVQLASCYETCLRLAEDRKLRTVTFPSISTGAYGYPLREAAPVAIGAVGDHLERGTGTLEEVTFVLFDGATLDEYSIALADWNRKRLN